VTPHLTFGAYSVLASPLVPWPLIITLAGLFLAIGAYAIIRRAHGGLLRLVLALVAIGLLANPSIIEEQRQYEKDIALVLVDRSPSQSLEHRQQDADAALAAIRKKTAEMADLDLQVVESTGGNDPSDKGTALIETLHRALADLPPKRVAGTIIISDGQIHDVPAEGHDPALTAPVHLLLTGNPDAIDRRLLLTETPTFGIVGKPVAVKLRVDDLGAPAGGGTTRLHVRRDGTDLPDMDAEIGGETTLQLPLAHGGPSVFEFNVADGPGELTRINNSAVITVNGIRPTLKVLLVSGEPSPGERTWRNLLKSDPAVNLIHFTILRPPAKSDATPINELALIAFPIEDLFRLKLKDFDLIIFDRFQHLNILPEEYFHNIVNYVENGGAVLEVAGPGSAGQFSLYQTPVAEIFGALPTGQEMLTGGFKPKLTDLGRRHPVTAGLLAGDAAAGKPDADPSWGRWFRQLPVTAGRGTTVMTGLNGLPLLILEHQGKGRVAQLLSDQIWLWSHGYEGGGPHAELIRRIAHWLMAEPELEEEDLRATVVDGKLEITRQSLGTDLPLVTVTRPDGQQEQVKLTAAEQGHATATLAAAAPGLYRVGDGQRQAFAAGGSLNALEFRDPRASTAPLAKLVQATGGGMVSYSKQGNPALRRVAIGDETAGNGWFGLRENRDYVVTGIRQTPLLPVWVALFLALGLMLLTWHREGR
jgi:hypothetical protein